MHRLHARPPRPAAEPHLALVPAGALDGQPCAAAVQQVRARRLARVVRPHKHACRPLLGAHEREVLHQLRLLQQVAAGLAGGDALQLVEHHRLGPALGAELRGVHRDQGPRLRCRAGLLTCNEFHVSRALIKAKWAASVLLRLLGAGETGRLRPSLNPRLPFLQFSKLDTPAASVQGALGEAALALPAPNRAESPPGLQPQRHEAQSPAGLRPQAAASHGAPPGAQGLQAAAAWGAGV